MGKIFAVISGKGGTGKSTVSVGLAAAFAGLGQSVLLVDLDEGLRCLDTMLGIEDNIVFDLGDLLNGGDFDDAVYAVKQMNGVSVIPAPRGSTTIDPEGLACFVQSVSDRFDAVVLDFPAGINEALIAPLLGVVNFITVCNPDPVSVRDAAAVSDALINAKTPVRLVINRFSVEAVKRSFGTNIDDIINRSGTRLIGIVPQSDELALLSVRHKVSRRKRAGKAFSRIALRLLGRDIKLPAPKKI